MDLSDSRLGTGAFAHDDAFLDVRGVQCPLPLLKTKVALNRLEPGQVLRVLATDPMAVVDLRAFCARTGHELLRWSEEGPVWEFYIRKAVPGG